MSATDSSTGGQSEDSVRSMAAAGVSGAGGPLPHLAEIQKNFGPEHADTLNQVRAHQSQQATSAADAIGAEAYATGNDIAFAGTPSLHTAAHEAAHVIQQRHGVSLKGGVGEAGDAYEQEADAAADAVVAGNSAQGLRSNVAHAKFANERNPKAARSNLQRKSKARPKSDWQFTAHAIYLSPSGMANAFFGSSQQDKLEIPHGSKGKILFAVDARFRDKVFDTYVWGEKFSTMWQVDATGEGITIAPLTHDKSNRKLKNLPGLDADSFTWTENATGEYAKIDLQSSRDDSLFGNPKREAHSFTLQLEKSFPNAKVTFGDTVTMSTQRSVELSPFAINSDEITGPLLDQIRDFWLSLSPDTKKAIRDNELPGGNPVLIEGYASTTGKRPENFSLSGKRAHAVMETLKDLSGNQEGKHVFKPISKGEYESPEATDDRKRERELETYRKVIVSVTDVKEFNVKDL